MLYVNEVVLSYVRLLCPWDFPGKNTGMGHHFLLQGIFPTQGSNLCVSPALAAFSDLEHNREQELGAENYAEEEIFLTNSKRARLWHWALTEQHLSTQGRETCSKFPYASDLGRQWSLWYGFAGPNLRNLGTAGQYKLQSSKYSTWPMLLPLLFEHPGQLFWNESLRRFFNYKQLFIQWW